MTRPRLRDRLGVALLVLGALAIGVGGALMPAASARSAPALEFTLSFGELELGTPTTRSDSFVLERDATLTSWGWVSRVGVLTHTDLEVQVCVAGGACVDPTTAIGSEFAAGEITVEVTATLRDDASSGQPGLAIGRLVFQADDPLAPTGWDVAVWIAVGLAAVTVGTVLVVAVRRRRLT